MGLRDDLLAASRRATEVTSQFEVRKRLADGYTRVDPALIASQAGVTVVYRDMQRLLGAFLNDGPSGILVNGDRPRGLVHMTCAHELGHFFLGHDSTADDTVDHGLTASSVEQQANQFAYSLLAPQWLVAATMKPKRWYRADLQRPEVIYQLSLRMGTSFTAMLWSLARLALLSPLDAQGLMTIQPKRLKSDALAGGDLDDANADVWVLDPSDRDRILEPGPTDRFVFDLPNHAAAGHLWTLDDLRSEGFTLEPVVHAARPRLQQGPVVVGGTGKTLRYRMLPGTEQRPAGSPSATGELVSRHVLALKEKAPWQGSDALGDRFALAYETEQIKDGYSVPERARRFAALRDNG